MLDDIVLPILTYSAFICGTLYVGKQAVRKGRKGLLSDVSVEVQWVILCFLISPILPLLYLLLVEDKESLRSEFSGAAPKGEKERSHEQRHKNENENFHYSPHEENSQVDDDVSGENDWCHLILGVGSDSSDEEIRKAFFKKAKLHHPDRNGDSDAMKALNVAYEALKARKKANARNPSVAGRHQSVNEELCARVLGIGTNPTSEEVRGAYRRKIQIHDPDQGGDPDMYRLVNLAYEALSGRRNTTGDQSPLRKDSERHDQQETDEGFRRRQEADERRRRQEAENVKREEERKRKEKEKHGGNYPDKHEQGQQNNKFDEQKERRGPTSRPTPGGRRKEDLAAYADNSSRPTDSEKSQQDKANEGAQQEGQAHGGQRQKNRRERFSASLRDSAVQGDVAAQYRLGRCYANGWGVEEDDVEAVVWYRRAAEQGCAQSQENLGWSYFNGVGTPKDDIEAYMWFELAAGQRPSAEESRNHLKKSMCGSSVLEAQRRAEFFSSTRKREGTQRV